MPKLRDTIIHNIIHLESWKLIMDRLLPFGRANTQKSVKQFQKNFIAFHFLVTSIVDNDIRIRILENICFLNFFIEIDLAQLQNANQRYSYDIYCRGNIFIFIHMNYVNEGYWNLPTAWERLNEKKGFLSVGFMNLYNKFADVIRIPLRNKNEWTLKCITMRKNWKKKSPKIYMNGVFALLEVWILYYILILLTPINLISYYI